MWFPPIDFGPASILQSSPIFFGHMMILVMTRLCEINRTDKTTHPVTYTERRQSQNRSHSPRGRTLTATQEKRELGMIAEIKSISGETYWVPVPNLVITRIIMCPKKMLDTLPLCEIEEYCRQRSDYEESFENPDNQVW